MVVCKTLKELGKAIKNNEDEIYLEITIGEIVLKIRAVGKVAWAVCAVALTVSIASIVATVAVPPAAPAAAIPEGAAAVAAVSILGSAAIPAVSIGVAAGGIGGLVALREKYKVVEKDDKHIILKRK